MLKSWKRTQLTSLESVKASKNELKTNSKLCRKQRNQDAKCRVAHTLWAGADIALGCLRRAEGAGRPTRAVSVGLSLRDIADPRHRGLRHPAPGEGLERDVKIVGTNSVNFFRISESFKKRTETNSKRTQNCAENSAIRTQNAGWRMRAGVFCWHVCAPLERPANGRIHSDSKRRDVCATQFSSIFAGRRPMGTEPKDRVSLDGLTESWKLTTDCCFSTTDP